MSVAPAVETEHLTHRYGDREALRDVSKNMLPMSWE